MVTLRRLSIYHKKPDCIAKWIEQINKLRALYPYSSRVFSENKIEGLYLVLKGQKVLGFCQVEFQNLDIPVIRPVNLYLHELHIAPEAHGQGVGSSVIAHLLKAGIPVEMVVANENSKMLGMLRRFGAQSKYEGEHTRTMVVVPHTSVGAVDA